MIRAGRQSHPGPESTTEQAEDNQGVNRVAQGKCNWVANGFRSAQQKPGAQRIIGIEETHGGPHAATLCAGGPGRPDKMVPSRKPHLGILWVLDGAAAHYGLFNGHAVVDQAAIIRYAAS